MTSLYIVFSINLGIIINNFTCQRILC